MAKKKEITIKSSAAEYLTYVAATGDNSDSFEMRYVEENIYFRMTTGRYNFYETRKEIFGSSQDC